MNLDYRLATALDSSVGKLRSIADETWLARDRELLRARPKECAFSRRMARQFAD